MNRPEILGRPRRLSVQPLLNTCARVEALDVLEALAAAADEHPVAKAAPNLGLVAGRKVGVHLGSDALKHRHPPFSGRGKSQTSALMPKS